MWFCSGRIDSERESRPEEAGLHAGTLDNTSWRAPVAYIWTRSAQPWVQFSDDALAFDTAPEGRGIPSQPLRERTWDLLDEMPSLTCTIEPLLQILEQLTTERKTLDKRLEQTARSDAVRQRLMSIPGVGPITGHAFRVTLDDPSRFDPSKAVGSHLGLTPKVYQPGETDRSGQISKSSDHLLTAPTLRGSNGSHDALPPTVEAEGVAYRQCETAWCQTRSRRRRSQTRGDHARLRERVPKRYGKSRGRLTTSAPGSLSFDHDLDDGNRSPTPPGECLRQIARCEIGRRNPRIPSWGGGGTRPRTEADLNHTTLALALCEPAEG